MDIIEDKWTVDIIVYEIDDDDFQVYVCDKKNEGVAICREKDYDSLMTNATLVASAAELQRALKNVLAKWIWDPNYHDSHDRDEMLYYAEVLEKSIYKKD